MPIHFEYMDSRYSALNRSIFLSSSIPDPSRWSGEYDALEITDAVVALARECLSRGYRIVTAAHPTIAPLLLYVAAEFPRSESEPPMILVYQSLLFENILPVSTRRFESDGVGEITWTIAADGDLPKPGHWDPSLTAMREIMLTDTTPSAAIFVGGMIGILEEREAFGRFCPDRPVYAISTPGGAAADLTGQSPESVREYLRVSRSYPAVWAAVLDDLESTLPNGG